MELGRESVEVVLDQVRLKDGLNRQRKVCIRIPLLARILSFNIFLQCCRAVLREHFEFPTHAN